MQFFKGDEVTFHDSATTEIVDFVKQEGDKTLVFSKASDDEKPVRAFAYIEHVKLVRRNPGYYGDPIVGVWHCNRCCVQFFPKELLELKLESPFHCPYCEVGELIYDEEA